jgi:hypothetical protein
MNQLTAGLIVVIGILGGFYGGAKYGQGHPTPSASPAASTSSGTAGLGAAAGGTGAVTGTGGTGGTGGFGNATLGQITAVNGDTITVHDTRNNRDVKVNIASARITKTTDGTAADLTQNQTVTVVGQAGSDGTVTASTIAVGTAAGAFGGRRGGASPSPAG